MSQDVKVTLNRKAVRELLNSREVRGTLYRRGQAIAERAGLTPTDEDTGEPAHVAKVNQGRSRARVSVLTTTPQAMEAEMTDRVLSSALDAGRGEAF